MGITIYYRLRFRGSESEVIDRLLQVGNAAQDLGFREFGRIWQVDYRTDFRSADQWTPMVPGRGEKRNELVIDPDYQWAKIQYDPTPVIPISRDDAPEVQHDMKQALQSAKARAMASAGWIHHLWFGDGCEATNIGLIRYGDSDEWCGAAFTKTQWAADFIGAHLGVCGLLKEVQALGFLETVEDEGSFWDLWDVTPLVQRCRDSKEAIRRLRQILHRFTGQTGLQVHGPGSDAGASC